VRERQREEGGSVNAAWSFKERKRGREGAEKE
jgi:hypothetical protein